MLQLRKATDIVCECNWLTVFKNPFYNIFFKKKTTLLPKRFSRMRRSRVTITSSSSRETFCNANTNATAFYYFREMLTNCYNRQFWNNASPSTTANRRCGSQCARRQTQHVDCDRATCSTRRRRAIFSKSGPKHFCNIYFFQINPVQRKKCNN